MAQSDPLRKQIIERFDGMPAQLKKAARYLLEHPDEAAFVSMRELARHADVQPATLTRLAKALGFDGYNALRAHYVETLRQRNDGFAARVRQQRRMTAGTETDTAERLLRGLSEQMLMLCEPETLERMAAMATRLTGARKVYVLGLRSSHVVAWHFHYVMSLLGERSIHLDGPAGTGGDALMHATPEDVLLIISIHPYTVDSLALAGLARDKGVAIASITDSEVSPLTSISEHTLFCPTDSESFFHTLAPALAISEVLCALLANANRAAALKALERADNHHGVLETYANKLPRPR